MSPTTLTALIAMTPSGVIGRDGDLPWRLSSDLRRFKQLTMGGVLLMGRRTYDSIGRPLPGRETVVVTRQSGWQSEGVHRASDLDAAVELAQSLGKAVFVVGGAEIYRQVLPRCDWLLLTRVWASVEGDTVLQVDLDAFEVLERSRFPASMKDDFPTEFIRYRRKAAGLPG